ncbi:MAG: metallophosphoesterase family protein [Oscillospiraceae bacterium]
MRIIAFSDTHGNSRAMREIFMRNEDADAFIFLGDGERELDRMRLCYPEKTILNVAGNCDYASMTPDNDIFIAKGVKVFFTHGHNMGVKFSTDRLFYKAKEIGASVALFGHTHCRFYQYEEGIHLLNPGSASCPRDGRPSSYAFIDITDSGIFCSHVDLK